MSTAAIIALASVIPLSVEAGSFVLICHIMCINEALRSCKANLAKILQNSGIFQKRFESAYGMN